MSDNIKLSIEDMNLFYGNFHALHDINMHIPEKEITAFIGPSGCGKSTLLKLKYGVSAQNVFEKVKEVLK